MILITFWCTHTRTHTYIYIYCTLIYFTFINTTCSFKYYCFSMFWCIKLRKHLSSNIQLYIIYITFSVISFLKHQEQYWNVITFFLSGSLASQYHYNVSIIRTSSTSWTCRFSNLLLMVKIGAKIYGTPVFQSPSWDNKFPFQFCINYFQLIESNKLLLNYNLFMKNLTIAILITGVNL